MDLTLDAVYISLSQLHLAFMVPSHANKRIALAELLP